MLASVKGRVEFANVAFAYPSRPTQVRQIPAGNKQDAQGKITGLRR